MYLSSNEGSAVALHDKVTRVPLITVLFCGLTTIFVLSVLIQTKENISDGLKEGDYICS